MDELIERLEKATEPDRELDLAIMTALSGDPWRWSDNFALQTVITWDKYGPGAVGNPVVSLEDFTASIDAALTLVPEGFQAYVDTGIGHDRAHACVWTDYPCRIQGGARQIAGPAIALCIAALKARAASSSNQGH